MAQKRETFRYGIEFDTTSAKKSLQELETLMNRMQRMSAGEYKTMSGKQNLGDAADELHKIQSDLVKVQSAYSKAFDSKLGIVNVQKMEDELKRLTGGQGIAGVRSSFQKLGAEGAAAFAKLHANSVKVSTAFRDQKTILDKMGETLANTIKWNISTNIVNSFSGKLQEAYGYVKNLDKSLNDIRIVTGKNTDEMAKFAQQANKAAQSLGQGTTDYTNASLIYHQQGLSDEDVQGMTDLTMKTANVTGTATETISEYLTALKNGYQIATEDMESSVDKMAAVAASTASDLGELSTAVSRVAATAASSGVSLDSLIAQISTIESVTRQAPESIGTALKTVYARLGDLKASGEALDEDGFTVKLGEVSGQLADMGINILDSTGAMRDQEEVIEEIGAKWQTWTKEQKEAAAIAMAGKRQYNNLFALFENFDEYNKAMQTAGNSLGTINEQQEIFLESTPAHLQRLSTQWEDLYDSMLDSNTINTVTDGLRGILSIITNMVDGLGGGINTLTTFGGIATQVFGKQLTNSLISPVIDSIQAQSFNQLAMRQTQNNIEKWKNEGVEGDAAVAQQKVAEQMSEFLPSLDQENIQYYNTLIDKVGEAAQKVNELREAEEEVQKEADLAGEALSAQFDELLSKTDVTIDLEGLEKNEKLVEDLASKLKDAVDIDIDDIDIEGLNEKLEELKQKRQDTWAEGIGNGEGLGIDIDKINNQINVIKEAIDENLPERYTLTLETDDYVNKVKEAKTASQELNTAQDGLNATLEENKQNLDTLELKQLAENMTETAGAVTSLFSAVTTLANIFDSFGEVIDGTKDPLEWIKESFSALIITIPSVIQAVATLKTMIDAAKVAKIEDAAVATTDAAAHTGLNAVLVAGATAAKKFWTALLGPAGAVLLAVGAIGWAIKRVVDALNEGTDDSEEKPEKLSQRYQDLTQKAQESSDALEQTKNRLAEIDDMLSDPSKLELASDEDIAKLQAEREELLAIKEAKEETAKIDAEDVANASYDKLKDSEPGKLKGSIVTEEGLTITGHEFESVGALEAEIAKNSQRIQELAREGQDASISGEMNELLQANAQNRAVLQTTENNIEYWANLVQAYGQVKKDMDKAREAGGEVDKTKYDEIADKLKNATERMRELKKAGEEVNLEGEKISKIDWFGTDEKGNSQASTFKDEGKKLLDQFSQMSNGDTFDANYFENSGFFKMFDSVEDLSDVLGEGLADRLFSLKEGTITDLDEARSIIEASVGVMNVGAAASDGFLSAEEIEKTNITLEDYDNYLVVTQKELSKMTKGTDEYAKKEAELKAVTQSYNAVIGNSVKQLGFTNEQFEGMQRSLKQTYTGLKDLEVGDQVLQKLAYDALKAQKNFDKTYKSINDLQELGKKGIDISANSTDIEVQAAFSDIRNSLAEGFGLDSDQISTNWVANNLEKIKTALINGGEELRGILSGIIQQDDFYLGLDIAPEDIAQAKSEFQLLQDSLPNPLEIGAEIDDSRFSATLDRMIQEGIITANNIQAALAGIGVEISPEETERIQYDLGQIEAISKGQKGSGGMPSEVADQLTSNLRADISGISFRAKPLGSASKSATPKKGGGGGGGSKGSKPSEAKGTTISARTQSLDKDAMDLLDEEYDRYHKIDTEINRCEKTLTRYGNLQDKLFGGDAVKNYNKVIAETDKKLAGLNEKLSIANDEQKELQAELATKGFSFTSTGNIANYKENLENQQAMINEQISAYNSANEKYEAVARKYNNAQYKRQKQSEQEAKKIEKATSNLNKIEDKDSYDSYIEKMSGTKSGKLTAKEKKAFDQATKKKNDKDTAELRKKINKSLREQKKLNKEIEAVNDYDALLEKEANGTLTKKEQSQKKSLEQEYSYLSAQSKLNKKKEELNEEKERLAGETERLAELQKDANRYDEMISEQIPEIIQAIDDAIASKAEAQLNKYRLVIQLQADFTELKKSWSEFLDYMDMTEKKSFSDQLRSISGGRRNAGIIQESSASNSQNIANLMADVTKVQAASAAGDIWRAASEGLTQGGANSLMTAGFSDMIANSGNTVLQGLYGQLSQSLTSKQGAESGVAAAKAQQQARAAEVAEAEKNLKAVEDKLKKAKKITKNQEQKLKEAQDKLDQANYNLSIVNDGLTNAENTLGEANHQVESLSNQFLETVQQNYQALMNASIHGEDMNALLEDAKEAMAKQQEYEKELQENVYQDMDNLGNVVSDTAEKFNSLISQLDNLISEYDKGISLAQKLFGSEGSIQKVMDLTEKKLQADRDTIAVQTQRLNSNRQTRDITQAKLDEVNQRLVTEQLDPQVRSQLEALQNQYGQVIKQATDEIIEAEKSITQSTVKSVENALELRNQGIQKAFLESNQNLTGMLSVQFDNMKEKYDWQKKQESDYYDEVNSAYQIEKLEYETRQKMSNLSVNAQQRITNLMNQQLGYLRKQDKLTKYQVERAEKLLQIELARIALEEAQNNKSTLRLRRDRQGNYSYAYTNDADDIEEKTQKLKDVIVDLYNFDKAELAQAQENIFKRGEEGTKQLETFMQKYVSLYGADQDKWSEEVKDAFYVGWNQIFDQMEEDNKDDFFKLTQASKNIDESGQMAADALNAIQNFSKDGMRIYSEDAQTIAKNMIENFGSMKTNLNTSLEDTQETFRTNMEAIDAVASETFNSVKDIVEGTSGAIQAINTDIGDLDTTLTKIANESVENTNNAISNLNTSLTQLGDWITKYKPQLEELNKQMETLYSQNIATASAPANQSVPTTQQANAVVNTQAPSTVTVDDQPRLIEDESQVAKGSQVYIDPKANIFKKKDKKFTDSGKEIGGSKNTPRTITTGPVTSSNNHGYFVEVGKDNWIRFRTQNGDWKNVYAKFDTGGYTGDWSGDEGRLALLHQKELVLNAQDTENMLKAIQEVKDLYQYDKLELLRTARIGASGNFENKQDIYITANFPSAQNRGEIEAAFNNLVNRANQYISRKF